MLALRNFVIKGWTTLVSRPFAMTEAKEAAAEAEPAQTADSMMLCDRYRVMGVLGEGAHGKVFSAVDSKTKRAVAIKISRPHAPHLGDSLLV